MSDKKAELIVKQFDSLAAQRTNWESHWQEIGDYIIPRKADINKARTQGDKRTELVFDGTALHAAELLSASLHGMLTNSSTAWFSLRFRNAELDSDDKAKEWLQSVEDVMYLAFSRSNFHEQVHELYHDLITFGTAVMFIESDPKYQLQFSTRHISECYLSEDEKGRVDTVFRKFKMPNRAVLQRFGKDVLSTKRLADIKEKPYEQTTLLHAVFPNDERDITKVTNINKPFTSIYVDHEEKITLSEGGFDELPYCCPRYLKSSFEIGYGRSPAMTALADTKMLNKMSEVSIRYAQKLVDPPLVVPDDGFMLPIRTVPGGLNFKRSGTRETIEPLNINTGNPLGLQMEQQRRDMIRQAFYVDQLILGASPNMTATEVMQRTEEKMRLLGPVMGRLQAELLQPLIERAYNILSRDNAFAEVPDILQNNDIEIDYVSPLAKAQRQGDVQSALQLLEIMAPLAQVDPSIMDYIDVDGMSKHIIKTLGVPATAVRGDEEVKKVRNERQAAQAVEQEKQDILTAAEAAGNAAPLMKALS